ncbi:MAG: FAD-dependent oxidoreductase, partial [Gammaproteobacteria bacterium]|nr:FAD-dependent oxidoreductase [Gammaproteobacteria bacterium]
MKRLVLVGGGHAHLSVLLAMAQRRPKDVELTLITPSAHQNYSGMLPGWISGHYAQTECRVDLRPLAETAGAQLVLESIVGMDAARRCVGLTDGQQVDYDLLSLDVGSEADTSWLLTLGDKLLPVKPLDDFYLKWPKVLRDAKAKANFRLVVVGAGAAGVEVALAAKHAFTQSRIDGQVDLVASESGLLAGHSNAVQSRVLRYVKRVGIALHCQHGVGTEDAVLLADGTELAADCVIAATGARTPVWVQVSGLALDGNGYIAVDRNHRSVSHANVFAAGDVCARNDVLMQRSGVHAVYAGPVLADNLIAALSGATP